MANLKKLHSFNFTLTLKRTEPPVVDGSFTGTIVLPDTEERTGTWTGITGPIPVSLKARGELEYLLEDTTWIIHSRGEEAGFLTQIERVLALDSFSPARPDGKYLTSSFTPNLPFLNPMLDRRLTGTFKANKDRLLPAEITAKSSDGVVSWRATFSDYDRAAPIVFPFVPLLRITLLPVSRPQTALGRLTTKDTAALRQRFRASGYATRMSLHQDTLDLVLEQEIRSDLLRLLFGPGEFRVGIGRYARGGVPTPNQAELLTLLDDTTRSVVMERLVLLRSDVSDVTTSESTLAAWRGEAGPSADTPMVSLSLTPSGRTKAGDLSKLEGSGILWLVAIDDRVVALAPIERRRDPARIALPVLGDLSFVRQLRAIAASPRLSTRLTVVAQQRIQP